MSQPWRNSARPAQPWHRGAWPPVPGCCRITTVPHVAEAEETDLRSSPCPAKPLPPSPLSPSRRPAHPSPSPRRLHRSPSSRPSRASTAADDTGRPRCRRHANPAAAQGRAAAFSGKPTAPALIGVAVGRRLAGTLSGVDGGSAKRRFAWRSVSFFPCFSSALSLRVRRHPMPDRACAKRLTTATATDRRDGCHAAEAAPC